ncbi:MAG: hypothetical protein HOI23_20300 [Deltaproteobacteria bacterium]|jgi:hypothetical protein|nr:hypothetical protein [Deltaproteobacteria bacterium]MBT6433118.1 hypothetical protein [Deltaproteobacteria bacterium]MBT6489170.1 hypothetical protein [Deltaproteobacteria bacterium]
MKKYSFVFTLILMVTGCTAEGLVSSGSDDDLAQYAGATLLVHSPASASIVEIGKPLELKAEILSAEGESLEFDAIEWTSNLQDTGIFTGKEGEVYLDMGKHDITASAQLPNGDRLDWTNGGVRVQSANAGIYAGSVTISVSGEFQDTPLTASCTGAVDFIVDIAGEVMGGSGSCMIELIVMDGFEVSYDVLGTIDGDEVSGNVQVSTGIFPIPVPWEGEFDDGVLSGGFDGDLLLFAFEGLVQARKVTSYTD